MKAWPFSIALVGALVWWNHALLSDRTARIRTKDLAFLPAPEVAQVLACGQQGSAARLRWIDSFAYLQLQFDRRDDRTPSGESGFARLYQTLITLDPHFVPFYEHGALTLGAIAGRPQEALALLQRGTLELPDEPSIWRNLVTTLAVDYKWEERQPAAFDGVLSAWAAHEATPEGQRLVWDWKAGMSRRRQLGTMQLGYWRDQMTAHAAGTPLGDYAANMLREVAGRNALAVLQKRLDARPGATVAALAAGLRGQPGTFDPFTSATDGTLDLRPDPWGFPYQVTDSAVVSPGLRRHDQRRRLVTLNMMLGQSSAAKGRVPADLAEALAWCAATAEMLPAGMRWRLAGTALDFDEDPPPAPPWLLR